MTTFRFRPVARRAVLALAIGALLGVLLYLDQQLMGGFEAHRAISETTPVNGFWWHVSGGAAFAVALLLFAGVFELLAGVNRWRARRWRDTRHRAYCVRYYDRRGRCSCPYEAQNWTPEERRAAWRTIQGGRPQ